MSKYWIAVASRDHVRNGIKECIAQVCHGKQSPLKRMKPDDWIIYYSPTRSLAKKIPVANSLPLVKLALLSPISLK